MVHQDLVTAVVFSPDGRWVATAICGEVGGGRLRTGSRRVFEATGGKEVAPPLIHRGSVEAVAFGPDGKSIAIGGDKECGVFEVASGKDVWSEQLQNTVTAVTFSADGKWVATGAGDGKLRLYEPPADRNLRRSSWAVQFERIGFIANGPFLDGRLCREFSQSKSYCLAIFRFRRIL